MALLLGLASFGVGCALVLGIDDVVFQRSGADAGPEGSTDTPDAGGDATLDVATPLECSGGCRVCGLGHGFCEDFDDDGGPRGWTRIAITQGTAALSDAHPASAPLSYVMTSDAGAHHELSRRICPRSGVRASFDVYVAEASDTWDATIAMIKIPGFEYMRVLVGKKPVASVATLYLADFFLLSPVAVSTFRLGTWVRINFEARIPIAPLGCVDAGVEAGVDGSAPEAGTVSASIGEASAGRTLSPYGTAESLLDFGLDSNGPWTVFVDNIVIDEL